MKHYTRRAALKLLGIGTMAIASIGLVGCEETNSLKDANEPLTVSEAFGQEGVWLRYYGSTVAKDTNIHNILVFDGNGNVTVYGCSGSDVTVTFGDLNGLSDDELIELAKEKDREVFDTRKQTAIDNLSESLESYTEAYRYHQDMIYEFAERVTWGQERNEAAEYQEPEAVPFTLKIETDDTGNATESETINFEYLKFNSSYFYSSVGNDPNQYTDEDLYEASEESIELELTISRVVYDMTFDGFDRLVTVVNEEHAGFTLDTPDTEGIEVD